MHRRPHDTLLELYRLFPEFEGWWNDEQIEDGLVDGVHREVTQHHVMMEFLDYFARNHASFSEKQLRSLSGWVNRAAAVDDDLGNAVTTCFLEHSHKLHIDRILAPYLSRRAKASKRG